MIHSEKVTRMGHAEILPLMTKTVPPYTTTNTIAYGRKNFVVLDPGTANIGQQEALARYIRDRIKNGQRFLGIFLTHHHGDHVRAATFLRDGFSVGIYAHENAKDILKFSVDHYFEDGEAFTIENGLVLLTLFTPGHSPDHLAFYDKKNKVLMAGDLMTDRGTVLITPKTGNLRLYLDSLDRISRLELNVLIPAHGNAIIDRPTIFLLKGLKHRYERILSVFETLAQCPDRTLSASDITSLTYRGLSSTDLFTLAQLSVESSLLWLCEHGLIENDDYEWQLTADSQTKKEAAILSQLAAIDQRMDSLRLLERIP